jgi:hypothetical protein
MRAQDEDEVGDPRRWKKAGWIAQVIKNEDDDGWAVSMTRVGDTEPVLVGPWTMGRDKKNPKPLDQPSFMALVKGANEVMMRHEQSARAQLHRTISFTSDAGLRLRANLDVAPDDDDPHAILVLLEETTGEEVRRGRVSPGFKLTAQNVERWTKSGEG